MNRERTEATMPDWKMFSADDHVDLPYLPGDLWVERVPRKFRDRVPRLVENAEEWHWEADGKLFGVRYRYDNYTSIRFGKSTTPVMQEPGRWRPTTPELRLEDMDRDGVECQVMYGGLISGFQLEEPELNTVSLRAYNDWIAEFCSASPERLIGLGFLPVHGVEAAVAELHHCARLGLKGVQFQAFDATRRVWDETWEPLWSAAEDTGLPISFHQGAGFWSTGRTNIPPGRGVDLIRITVVAAQLDEVLASLVLSGILERHPKFRAVLGESSLGWIPYILQKMDQEYAIRPRMRPTGAGTLTMKPSEYYQRQVYATFQEDAVGLKLLDELGTDTVLWASDYPHGDSVWPYSHETVEQEMAGMDEAVVRKITRDNARKLYLGEA